MSDHEVDDTPWEVSVFAALLNMRWAHYVQADRLPDAMNALDGPAETALADVILKHDDRLFLLELKATWERAASETKKPIFRRYKALHSRAQMQSDSTEFDELMLWSVRCHHLVYWEDGALLGDGSVRGSISFSPYALCVLDRVIGSRCLRIDFRKRHSLALKRQGGASVIEAAEIQALFNQSAKAVSGNLLTGAHPVFSELGLSQVEFLKFVQCLRGSEGQGNIALKLIAFSPRSGFVRRICSLDEAVALGVDWANDTASAKPVQVRGDHRTGKARKVGEQLLICSASTQSLARGLKGPGGKRNGDGK
ncbi:hypothetical protein V3391_10950 [Luteimonas sp. SMYT11W]|uniref:Uncharacterized protein n=1 Tax=Luteimonas flava TaxID=3115822 RepID=A0ABU7WGT9_9GAMM